MKAEIVRDSNGKSLGTHDIGSGTYAGDRKCIDGVYLPVKKVESRDGTMVVTVGEPDRDGGDSPFANWPYGWG